MRGNGGRPSATARRAFGVTARRHGHRMAALAALLSSIFAFGARWSLAQPGGAVVVFESPEEDGYVSGPTPLRIRVEPATVEVRSVSLSADGRLVCTVDRPPYECPWDAGSKVVEHTFRAAVVLADGRRIARSVRTRGVAYTETVDVDVVQVIATVTDSRGRFVKGLTREAFRVLEDGVPQGLTGFAAENIPLEIMVAIDVSGSMKDAMPVVKRAVKKFLSALRPEDRVTVLGFNDNVFTLARPAADMATRMKAVDRLAPWGGTALYDVVVQSVDQLGKQTGRKALVVFTDGEDLNSRAPIEVAERRLEASDAVVYAIGQGRAPGMKELKDVLERIARKSGGRAFFEDLDELDDVFARIVEDLSNQYMLGYVPKDPARDGRFRAIKVDVPGRDVRIRARQGYRRIEK